MAGPIEDFLRDVRFENFFDTMISAGWFKYFFPFLLMYAITLTILEKISIFQDEENKNKKPIRVIIAFVFSITTVAFPVNNEGYTFGDLINSLFPGVGIFAMGILGLYIIAAMMGKDLFTFLDEGGENDKYVKYLLGALGVIWVIIYFGRGLGYWDFGDVSNNWFIDLLKDPFLWIIAIMILMYNWINSD